MQTNKQIVSYFLAKLLYSHAAGRKKARKINFFYVISSNIDFSYKHLWVGSWVVGQVQGSLHVSTRWTINYSHSQHP